MLSISISLRMHNKRTHAHVHYPRMLVWCSSLSLAAITAINVHAALANLSCRCLHTCEIFKNIQQELRNTHVCDVACILQV